VHAQRLLPNNPPEYFPPATGRYDVKPGLVRFGKPLGGGEADGHVFQFDASFPRYREAKLAARRERLDKYFRTMRLTPDVEARVCRFIAARLASEHPGLFELNAAGVLSCSLTGERITSREVDSPGRIIPPYISTFDALACQVQEDLAVISSKADEAGGRSHWLSAVHLCFPNAWAAEDKMGRAFAAIHEPVAEIEQINRQADGLVETMLNATTGLVRFAWGVTWDDELNHHPEPPAGASRCCGFDPANPRAILRVERQTVWGFPDVGAALFTIRTYLYDCADIRRDAGRRRPLVSALESMSPASLAYKGMAGSRDALLAWLGAAR
jgi:hypothetical protein